MVDCEVITVSNGEQLVAYLKTTRQFPCFIFLDINMPRLNGIECLRHIRTNYPDSDVRVIMLSTAISTQVVEQSYRLGADLYIQKPGKFNELKRYVQYCLNHQEQRVSPGDFVLNDLLGKF